jgi:hypothetical protein
MSFSNCSFLAWQAFTSLGWKRRFHQLFFFIFSCFLFEAMLS